MKRRGLIAALAGIMGIAVRRTAKTQLSMDNLIPDRIALYLDEFKNQSAVLEVVGDSRRVTLSAKEIMDALLEVPTARFTGKP